jgi:hypothetical protein
MLNGIGSRFSYSRVIVEMLVASRIACLCILPLTIGCGGGLRELDPGDPPPHGGEMILLRDDKGAVEVVKKTVTEQPVTAEVSFYFYKDPKENGGKPYGPWDSVPESGVLLVGKNQKVNLVVADDALVTPTGPALFAKKEIGGELSITIDGETILIPLEVR